MNKTQRRSVKLEALLTVFLILLILVALTGARPTYAYLKDSSTAGPSIFSIALPSAPDSDAVPEEAAADEEEAEEECVGDKEAASADKADKVVIPANDDLSGSDSPAVIQQPDSEDDASAQNTESNAQKEEGTDTGGPSSDAGDSTENGGPDDAAPAPVEDPVPSDGVIPSDPVQPDQAA